MSQQAIFELLRKLGGKATSKQISELALKTYPEYTLHSYVGKRLSKLVKRGYVRKNGDGTWEIITKEGPRV